MRFTQWCCAQGPMIEEEQRGDDEARPSRLAGCHVAFHGMCLVSCIMSNHSRVCLVLWSK